MSGPLTFIVLVFLTATIGTSQGKPPATTTDPGVTSTARIVHHDPVTGIRRNLHKHDIEKLAKGENHPLRIHFENSDWPHLDMSVSQGSVWSKDSVAVARRGRHKILVPHAIDENCFLRGRLVGGHHGVVTINRCGRMSGSVDTGEHHYQIEEHEAPPADGSSLSHTTFKITKRRHERSALDDHYEQRALDMMERAAEMGELEEEEDDDDNATIRVKREAKVVKIEVVVYMDRNFAERLYFDRGMDSDNKIRAFMVTKWDKIQAIFENKLTIGAIVTVDLKRIEIWWTNPEGYPADEVLIGDRNRWFCRNTPETDQFDLKALYTVGTGSHPMGIAFVGDLCRQGNKCFTAKSPTDSIRIDVHELGHTLGFKHDPDIEHCDAEGGFMGWDETLRYMPCYRKVLRSKLKTRQFRCLFEDNVSETLPSYETTPYNWATATPYWDSPC